MNFGTRLLFLLRKNPMGFLLPMVIVKIFFMIVFCCEANAATKALTFTPKKVAGSVYFWTTDSGAWKRVRQGIPLAEKTLIQVGDGSQLLLVIASQSGFADRPGNTLEADITTPMVFRLERDLLRSAKINRKVFTIQDIKSESKGGAKSAFGKLLRGDFHEANSDVVEGGKNRIKVNFPGKDNHIHVEGFPAVILACWELLNMERQSEVQVLIWPEGEDRGPPFAVTRSSVLSVPVLRPGVYNLQIASLDWKAKSVVRRFSVHAQKSKADEEIVLDGPTDGFIYAADRFPVNVPFSWRFKNDNIPVNGDFEVVVAPENPVEGKETIYRVTRSQSTVLTFLKPASFFWFVRDVTRRRHFSGESEVMVSSQRSKFTLTTLNGYLGSQHKLRLGPAIVNQLKSSNQASIFLEKLP